VDARGKLLHPGLINAHTHAHGNLAKGMGDRWTLELLLTTGPWISGGRSLEEKHLSAKLGAVEMVLKGCTACYDLPLEWPAPTAEGLGAVGSAYAAVGMRAVVAPMVADRTFFEAVPGLMEVLPPPLQHDVEKETFEAEREIVDGEGVGRRRDQLDAPRHLSGEGSDKRQKQEPEREGSHTFNRRAR